jgi:hypothetical protein
MVIRKQAARGVEPTQPAWELVKGSMFDAGWLTEQRPRAQ